MITSVCFLSHSLNPGLLGVAGACPSCLWARPRVCPSQVASPSQGQHRHKETITADVAVTWMSLDCGRKHTEKTHGSAGRAWTLHTERPGQLADSNPCSEATVRTTVPLCHNHYFPFTTILVNLILN